MICSKIGANSFKVHAQTRTNELYTNLNADLTVLTVHHTEFNPIPIEIRLNLVPDLTMIYMAAHASIIANSHVCAGLLNYWAQRCKALSAL